MEKIDAETKKVKNNIGVARTTTKTATKTDFGIINVDQFSSSVVADDKGKEEESIETNRLYNTQSFHDENNGNYRKSFRYDNYKNEQQHYQQKQQHAPLSAIQNNKQKLTVKTKYLIFQPSFVSLLG